MVAPHATCSFHHRNALGSVMEITDMDEAEVVSCRSAPYAPVTITVSGTPQSSDQLGNPWTYTGRFHDEETGLYYYRARYYSPETGRFLQRDPLGYPDGHVPYSYCRSSPCCRVDPSGMDDVPDLPPGPAPNSKYGGNDKYPGGRGAPRDSGREFHCLGGTLRFGRVGGAGFWYGVEGEPGIVYEFQQWERIRVWYWVSPPGKWVQAKPSGTNRKYSDTYQEDAHAHEHWYPDQGRDVVRGTAMMNDNPLSNVVDAATASTIGVSGVTEPPNATDWFKIRLDLRGEIIDQTHNRVIATYHWTLLIEANLDLEPPTFSKTMSGGTITGPTGGPQARR